jgi:hypothetical protein
LRFDGAEPAGPAAESSTSVDHVVRRGRAITIAHTALDGTRFRLLLPGQKGCRCPFPGKVGPSPLLLSGCDGNAGAHLVTYGSVATPDVPIRVRGPCRRGTV